MKRNGLPIALALAAALACGSRSAGQVRPDSCGAAYLPLPEVPATLRTPASRAAYVLARFWDGMDFADPACSRSRDFMERNLANYLSLFPIADTAALPAAADTLVARASADTTALTLLLELVGKYLYEPESPVYNETYYALFAEAFLRSPVGTDKKARLREQVEAVRKNRPGTPAADFGYETPQGKRQRMSETGAGKPLVLVFYDPDCGHCREVMAELEASESLRRALEREAVAVLAIYSGFDDRETWRRSLSGLPEAWLAGYDNGAVYARRLYVPRSLPALYLLDPDRLVLAKEPSAPALAALLDGLLR